MPAVWAVALPDIHALSLPFPVQVGFRAGYETKGKRFFGDLLLSVSFTI